MFEKNIIATLSAFFFALMLAPLVISFIKKKGAGQPILEFVEEHESKSGTPTMGGVIFIVAITAVFAVFQTSFSIIAFLPIFAMIAFGLLGFADDFIKVRFRNNAGLSPLQKLFFQVAIATIFGLICYFQNGLSVVMIPFANITVDFSFWIVPFVVVFFLAVTNSVNLTDGLDGLAGSVSVATLASFVLFFSVCSPLLGEVSQNLVLTSHISIGALMAFLCFNVFPAKVFMGDTGSMALGGLLAAIFSLAGMQFFMVIFGVMFVASSVSDIVQVAIFKKTKKRVFLMAPLHHHFQKKGVHENKITFAYFVVTMVIGIATTLAYV